ncbi:MAG: hypothetical protein AAF517_20425 [Planctomycetota bacterium]
MPKKRNKKTKGGPWYAKFLPEQEIVSRVARSLTIALSVVVIAAGVYGALDVKRRVETSDKFFLDSWQLDFGRFESWVTPEIVREITAISTGDGTRLSLFRKGVLDELKARVLESAWIEDVGNFQLRYPTSTRPGVIAATLQLRRPVALIESRGHYYLVDQNARRLGEPYDVSPAEWFEVPVIRGAWSFAEIPEKGEPWLIREVREGVEVARILVAAKIREQYPQWPIDAIDVSNVGGRRQATEGEIVLHCAGRRLDWGRSPLSPKSRTISTEDLIANLRLVLSHMHETEFKLVRLYYPQVVIEKG